jgi:hypothetical protein
MAGAEAAFGRSYSIGSSRGGSGRLCNSSSSYSSSSPKCKSRSSREEGKEGSGKEGKSRGFDSLSPEPAMPELEISFHPKIEKSRKMRRRSRNKVR